MVMEGCPSLDVFGSLLVVEGGLEAGVLFDS